MHSKIAHFTDIREYLEPSTSMVNGFCHNGIMTLNKMKYFLQKQQVCDQPRSAYVGPILQKETEHRSKSLSRCKLPFVSVSKFLKEIWLHPTNDTKQSERRALISHLAFPALNLGWAFMRKKQVLRNRSSSPISCSPGHHCADGSVGN